MKKRLIHLEDGLCLTTKQLVIWCREKGYTPQRFRMESTHREEDPQLATNVISKPNDSSVASIDGNELMMNSIPAYCKYCGLQHRPRKDFDQIQKNCPYKPTGESLNGAMRATILLSVLKPLDRNSDLLEIDLGERIHSIEPDSSIEMDSSKEEVSITPIDPRLLEWIVNCLKRIQISLGVYDPKTVDTGIIAGNAIIVAMKCFLKDLMKTAAQEAVTIKEEASETEDSTSSRMSSLKDSYVDSFAHLSWHPFKRTLRFPHK